MIEGRMIDERVLELLWTKDRAYCPRDEEGILAYLIEELGEALAAIGKLQRFGPGNFHPTNKPKELNSEALLRELGDVELAILLVKRFVL